jgi:hypothetical protein
MDSGKVKDESTFELYRTYQLLETNGDHVAIIDLLMKYYNHLPKNKNRGLAKHIEKISEFNLANTSDNIVHQEIIIQHATRYENEATI